MDLDRFSPQQCAAITAGEGPLSILAGPGSGKTTTLAGRIAYLVGERHVPPTSILAITFTTAAAAALRRQLQTVLGDAAAQVDIRTFHSFGLRVIRSWSDELGFGNTPPAVYGREDARAVLREAAREVGLAVTEHHTAEKRDAWAISLAQLDHALERHRLRCAREDKTTIVDDTEIDVLDGAVLADLAAAYERRLKSYAAVDYPGMLTLPLHLLEENSRALHMLQDAYRWILVDEYQDCCRLQASLLQQLTSRHHNLTVVGDPFQSIYRFRGADPRLLVEFPDAFAGAQVLVLEQNYRSTRTVVALANSLVAPLGERPASWTVNPAGPPARVYAATSDADEARFVAAEVARLLRAGELSVPGPGSSAIPHQCPGARARERVQDPWHSCSNAGGAGPAGVRRSQRPAGLFAACAQPDRQSGAGAESSTRRHDDSARSSTRSERNRFQSTNCPSARASAAAVLRGRPLRDSWRCLMKSIRWPRACDPSRSWTWYSIGPRSSTGWGTRPTVAPTLTTFARFATCSPPLMHPTLAPGSPTCTWVTSRPARPIRRRCRC